MYVSPADNWGLETLQGMDAIWIHFHASVQATGRTGALTRIPDFPPVFYRSAPTSALMSHAERVVHFWSNPSPEGPLLARANLLELVAGMMPLAQELSACGDKVIPGPLVKAQRFIEENASRSLALDEVSRHVGLSKFHLARAFRQAFGISPLQYHLQMRIRLAERLLSLDHLSVAEVASQLGYSSIQTFSRAFRRTVGVSPRGYRS